jgi:predicted nucleic acid-binding protein
MLVFNASPLIVSAKAGLISRFLSIWPDILIPIPVVEEVLAPGREYDPAVEWLSKAENKIRWRESNPPSSFLQAWDLGLGETSVLQFCSDHSGYMAVLDDMAARNCAKACGVPVTGTVGLLLQASHLDTDFSLKDGIQSVRDAGLYLSDSLVERVLQKG